MGLKQRIKQFIKRILRLNPVAVPEDAHPRATIPNSVLLPEVVRLVNEGHTVTLPLKGNSMRPFLCHMRDKALLTQLDGLHVGDPVLAETAPGHFVLHRLIAVDGDNVTLRGDGNLGDEHCRREDVKALAAGFFRKGRSEADMITSRKWRIYSWFWTRLYPFRRYLLMLHHLFFRSQKILD